MITSCKMGCKVDCRAIFACRPPCGAFSGTLRPANKTRKASLDAVSGVRQKGKGSTLSQGSACAQPRDQQEAFLSVRALPFPTVNVRCCVLCTQALRSNIDCVELFEVGTRAGLLSALQLVPCRSYGAIAQEYLPTSILACSRKAYGTTCRERLPTKPVT